MPAGGRRLLERATPPARRLLLEPASNPDRRLLLFGPTLAGADALLEEMRLALGEAEMPEL